MAKSAIEIIEALKGKKGQHVLAVWQRAAKVAKSCPFLIVKRTEAWVRSGIQYSNLSTIRDAIEAGTREAVEGLPWGQWREGYANYIIDHKDKEYIRLYPASFDNLSTPKVQWAMDGKPCQYSDVEPYLLASEKHKDEDRPACFTVNAENIIEIAGE
jgi:hypothetical protein